MMKSTSYTTSYNQKALLNNRSNTQNVFYSRGSPNTISLLDADGDVQYQTTFSGPESYEKYPELKEAYNAYAPNGTVTVRRAVTSCSGTMETQHISIHL